METVYDTQSKEETVLTEPPKLYHVVMLNDDFSSWELVVEVCTTFFGKTEEESNRIATDVHTKGKGVVGTFTKDVAETKAITANEFCQASEMPLSLTVEQE